MNSVNKERKGVVRVKCTVFYLKMSDCDLWVRDLFTAYGFLVLALSVITIFIWTRRSSLQKSIYKSYLTGFEVECAELALPYKKHLFGLLQEIVSSDDRLRSMGCIRVLEIGVKTGGHRT